MIVIHSYIKKSLYILTLVLFTILFSCKQPSGKKENTIATADTLQTILDKTGQKNFEKSREIEKQDFTDSIRLDKVLVNALKIANQNMSKDSFNEKYKVMTESIFINVDINLDYHFTKSNPHLIIRRNSPNAVNIDIYSKSNRKFQRVLSHKQWSIEYINDNILEINGDGLNDFVVNWYGSTGCCLKGFSNIYILQPNMKTFSNNFEFINPTFSPIEKIIRGVCYGHPGDTELYKYKWNGNSIDTLEYVSYEKNDKGAKTGKIIIKTERLNDNNHKTVKTLNLVPDEYRKIEGYDWFVGEAY